MTIEMVTFWEEMPRKLLESMTRVVIDSCRAAKKLAEPLGDDLRRDSVPELRRLLAERGFRDLFLPSSIQRSVERTPSSSFVKFESKKLILTAVTRSEDVRWLVPYPYRETLARPLTRSLFQEEEIPIDQKLYGVLVYGGHLRASIPTVAKVVFPLTSGRVFLEVNLMNEFPGLFGSPMDTPVQTASPEVKLRRPAEEKKIG